MEHPERPAGTGIDPSVNELLRLREFVEGLSKLSEGELRSIATDLAELAMVTYPASIRWLIRDMQNLHNSRVDCNAIAEKLQSEKSGAGVIAAPE